MVQNFSNMAAFIWSVADLLRGNFKQSQYGRVILPFTLLRRLECVLAPTKPKVLEEYKKRKKSDIPVDQFLRKAAKKKFYNTSKMDLTKLGETQTLENLDTYIRSFSPNAREIFEHFDFNRFLERLDEANLLYLVVQKFASMDLSPKTYPNYEMGLVFEELIRRFAESSNETAGEHFTPRDIVHLATALLFTDRQDKIAPGKIVTVYDPTAGTGGFLSEGEEYIRSISERPRVRVFGQELNPESYAICKGDMLIKGHEIDYIRLGNTLSDDQLSQYKYDFMLSNPPFGVDWKRIEKQVRDEHQKKGFNGRFGPGLPRVSDGSLLFLLHLISRMRRKKDGGSRIGIILNGSPLFTGGAGSGESEIRRYILENDLLEAIVALPTDMFYNTGIATYIWILSNSKPPERKNKVQLINAGDRASKMRKSLGSKRKYLTENDIDEIVRIYGKFRRREDCKIFKTRDFGYRRITIERPLRLQFTVTEEKLQAYEAAHTEMVKKQAKNGAPKGTEVVFELQPPTGWDVLNERLDKPAIKNRDKFLKLFKEAGIKLSIQDKKLLIKHFGEHHDEADICKTKGKVEPNPDLRDYENVPLNENIRDYFEREVKPYVPDAWVEESKKDERDGQVGAVGYEIPFNRHFYKYQPPRPLREIDADLDKVSQEIMKLLSEVHV